VFQLHLLSKIKKKNYLQKFFSDFINTEISYSLGNLKEIMIMNYDHMIIDVNTITVYNIYYIYRINKN